MTTIQTIWLVAALSTAALAGAAAAQTAEPKPGLPGPVVGGRDIQPHQTDIPGGQTDAEAAELLRETNDAGPLVPPHDLYGNPLGVDTTNITTDPGKRTATPPPH